MFTTTNRSYIRLPGAVAIAVAVLAGSVAADDFGDYWHQGKAELTSYTLQQARYGEIHDGHAVLIYVTEDFSLKKHVKLDDPSSAGSDRVNILKLNFTKKFNTGLYPYSMMTSVFKPINAADSRALKVTTSSQEWCGHTFSQLNREKSGYRVQQYSYFESDGDRSLSLEQGIPEDELWLTIRLDPETLPTGDVKLIPSSMAQRLRHMSWGVQRVVASLETSPADSESMTYTISYPETDRKLSIQFKKAFPHEIEGWEETYRSGWGASAKHLVTRATRSKRMLSDYWTKNSVVDVALRQKLGLD